MGDGVGGPEGSGGPKNLNFHFFSMESNK